MSNKKKSLDSLAVEPLASMRLGHMVEELGVELAVLADRTLPLGSAVHISTIPLGIGLKTAANNKFES